MTGHVEMDTHTYVLDRGSVCVYVWNYSMCCAILVGDVVYVDGNPGVKYSHMYMRDWCAADVL